jgi:hypothetical protein
MSEEKRKSNIFFSWNGLTFPLDDEFKKGIDDYIWNRVTEFVQSKEFDEIFIKAAVLYSKRTREAIEKLIKEGISREISYGNYTITIKPTDETL